MLGLTGSELIALATAGRMTDALMDEANRMHSNAAFVADARAWILDEFDQDTSGSTPAGIVAAALALGWPGPRLVIPSA